MKNVDRGPIVQTTAGRLWGIWESGLAVFRGIPYAAGPVGVRRSRIRVGWAFGRRPCMVLLRRSRSCAGYLEYRY
jgi:hypothetical protein